MEDLSLNTRRPKKTRGIMKGVKKFAISPIRKAAKMVNPKKKQRPVDKLRESEIDFLDQIIIDCADSQEERPSRKSRKQMLRRLNEAMEDSESWRDDDGFDFYASWRRE